MTADPRVSHDIYRPSALPSATLGRGASSHAQHTPLEHQLDQAEEQWNVRIDRVVKAMATGLKEVIQLAETSPTLPPSLSSLTLRTSSLISTASSLRDLTHELKLMLLLSDEVGLAERRDREVGLIKGEIREKRRLVGEEVGRLLGGEAHGVGGRDVNGVNGVGDEGGGVTGGRRGGEDGADREHEGGVGGVESWGEGDGRGAEAGIVGEEAAKAERAGSSAIEGATEGRPAGLQDSEGDQAGEDDGEEDMEFDEVGADAEEEEL